MAKLRQFHLLAALAFVFFSAFVKAQWQWGGQAGGQTGGQLGDEDDDDFRNPSNRNQPNNQPNNQPRPQQNPFQAPWNQPVQQPQWQQPKQPQPPWAQPQQPQQPWQQQPQQPWQQQPQQPWQQQPRPPQQQNPAPWYPNQPWQPAPTPQPKPPAQPRPPQQGPAPTPPPNNGPVIAQPSGSRTKTWSQPSQWGPSRSPFGPSATQSGPQTIPTTTTEAYREPVPYLTHCGRNRYVEYDVSNALIAGCYHKNKTRTVNNSEFPKPFQNVYGFNFGDTRPPYWEFPLIDSAAYIGGPPGPDRVIFNEACFLAGEITQTNAGARQWTECAETY